MKKKKIKKGKIKEIKKEKSKPKILPDHIRDYFDKVEGTKEQFHSRELLRATENDVDLKTHLNNEEIAIIATLFCNDAFLKKKKLKPIFGTYVYKFMRLKFSLDRLSRGEFVNVNKAQNKEDILSTMSNIKNITDVRK